MFDMSRAPNRFAFLKIATAFEFLLVIVAYLIGWYGNVDPLKHLHLKTEGFLWGLAGTVPLYLVFLVSYGIPLGKLYHIKRFLIERLGPFLHVCSLADLFYLGLLAGFTEEILFRGVLQPLLEARWGWIAGIVFSNLLFALAHFVTPLYALLAGLTGIYLGFALDFGGERNLLTPIVIHAVYDFLAFTAVARTYRLERGAVF